MQTEKPRLKPNDPKKSFIVRFTPERKKELGFPDPPSEEEMAQAESVFGSCWKTALGDDHPDYPFLIPPDNQHKKSE